MTKSKKDDENIDRSWHPNFVKYTEMIVNCPEYEGLFYERKQNNRIKWVVPEKSPNGQIRKAWWNKKCNELGIPLTKGCYALAAERIHPTKKHVCQCCGRSLSIRYEYPTKKTLKKINAGLKINISRSDYTIEEIIQRFCDNKSKLDIMSSILNIDAFPNKKAMADYVYTNLVLNHSKLFSPGVMSNSPDRFDGYHSDGLCCREKTDKGRHIDNMKTYGQDRRAYEEWSDGNWNLANRIMSEFHKHTTPHKCPNCPKVVQMTADHIGPISLGFCHSQYFAPLCSSCNSSKNNRFYKKDVDELIKLEKEGNEVISWHSKYIWDTLKNEVNDNEDAKRLSLIMLRGHQSVLLLFSIIYEETGEEFLMRYLHPQYSMYKYEFENFDPMDLSSLKINEKNWDSTNKRKNKERYIRIAFESLEEFKKKDNRRTKINLLPYESRISEVIDLINSHEFNEADKNLKIIINDIGSDIIKEEWN